MLDGFNQVTLTVYEVRDGTSDDFEDALASFWSALHLLSFIAPQTPRLFRSVSPPLRYLEITKWTAAMRDAIHQHP
ncbi:hypothetical protein SB658_22690, partial [Bacillus sp. SIMBA_008]|uniref:hypothetical protein n=1 Tax=Bacillus sp. SIMBA_008 TaxID=3085757 RepID=UPI00397DE1DE